MIVVTDGGDTVDTVPLMAPDAVSGAGPHRLALRNDSDPQALAALLAQAALVSVAFPNFADGRGFSLARRLRAAGYRGRLRASGALIPDQYGHARRCGFDEVALAPDLFARQGPQTWRAAAAAATAPVPPIARRRAG